ncbi:hypothetical protein [Vreelandella alkaliphila]
MQILSRREYSRAELVCKLHQKNISA